MADEKRSTQATIDLAELKRRRAEIGDLSVLLYTRTRELEEWITAHFEAAENS